MGKTHCKHGLSHPYHLHKQRPGTAVPLFTGGAGAALGEQEVEGKDSRRVAVIQSTLEQSWGSHCNMDSDWWSE